MKLVSVNKWLMLGLVALFLAGVSLADTKNDALDAYRKWLQCVATKGVDHEDCRKLHQAFLVLAYQRLEELKAEYQRECSDSEKAETPYCKELARQIEELEEAINDVTMRTSTKDQAMKAALDGQWNKVYDILSSRDPKGLTIMQEVLLGYACLDRKDWLGAWQHFSSVDKNKDKQALLVVTENLCKSNLKSAMAFLLKGDALARLGRYDDADTSLDLAIVLDAKQSLAYDLRSLSRSFGCRYQEAASDLDKAIALNSSNVNAQYERSVLDFLVGDFEEAIKGFTSILAQEPQFFLARNARGVAYLLLADYEKALQDFDTVIEQYPGFMEAVSNKQLTLVLRAKGMFAVDMKKLAAISPKGVLGSKVTTDLYYAGAGINSPNGGQTLLLAKQRAGSDAMVLTIRERDYITKGLTANHMKIGKSIAQDVAMTTLEAKAQGKNLIVSVIPNLENYKGQLFTEYMFGKKQWQESRLFCSTAMDASLSGYRSATTEGHTNAMLHSFHGDAVPLTKGVCYDNLDLLKVRTGAGLNDPLAIRLQDYKAEGKTVNLITGRGDIPSLWNAATKSSADKLAVAGLITASYFDKVNHGHGIALANSLYEVRTQFGVTTMMGDLSTLTRKDVSQELSKAGTRSGVFMMLGPKEMDVKKASKDDLGFILGVPNKSGSTEQEPDIAYPFLLFNPQQDTDSLMFGGPK